MTNTGRKLMAAIVAALASLAILITLLAHYADHILVNSSSFANRAVSLVQTPGVESMISGIVTSRVVADAGHQTSVQPLIESAVGEALSNTQISTDVRDAAASLQSQLVSGTATRLTLSLPDVGPSIAASIESRSPALADEVRNLGTITVVDVQIPPTEATVVHDLADASRDSVLLVILSIALVVLALLLSPSRARTLRALGIGAAISGLLAVAVYLVGRGIVVNEFSAGDAQTAAGAVWSTYIGGLETWGFVLAGIGALIAGLAASRVRNPRHQAQERVPLPRRPRG
jgi:hypothetical protein